MVVKQTVISSGGPQAEVEKSLVDLSRNQLGETKRRDAALRSRECRHEVCPYMSQCRFSPRGTL